MQDAFGVLGWTPAMFWKASLTEYFAAVKGWNDLQQGRTGKPKPLSRDEFNELVEWDKQRIAAAKRKQANG